MVVKYSSLYAQIDKVYIVGLPVLFLGAIIATGYIYYEVNKNRAKNCTSVSDCAKNQQCCPVNDGSGKSVCSDKTTCS